MQYLNNGLSNKEVIDRINNNLVNDYKENSTKTIPKIILNNFITLFNILNFFLAILVFFTGTYKNTLFLGVVFCNIIISTTQEIRSKKILDKLKLINDSKITVIRDGKIVKIDTNKIVKDDLYLLSLGNQIVVDSVILEGSIEVDESFLTGESETVSKKPKDLIKSGSFVVSGMCKSQVLNVGSTNYINTISNDAKFIKKENSVLLKSLKKIIKIISFLIIPIGVLLFINQYKIDNNLNDSIINTVAALIGMIPEGLVLLTSTVLAVAIMRLSKIKVLAQDLYSIEMLARVDTICLDKTGTLTDGDMEVVDFINLSDYNVLEIMGNIVNNMDINNATSKALYNYFKKYDNYKVVKKINFSSEKKYSGVEFENGTFLIGAKEYLINEDINLKDYSDKRILVLCKKDNINKLLAIIVLKDKIRKNAKKMIDYFKKENIDIKIISGDGIDNVKNIASIVGIPNIKAIDLSKNKIDEATILQNNIYVRATPNDKKEIIKLLQKNNHYVAMAGDGVNDVLALKQADCALTIKSGSEMAKNVSEIVILDDDFNSIPNIIKEGRRSINNLERSATLFLAKTGYSFLLALIFIFLSYDYPFEPIQLTLTSIFTIGIPSFILALEPNLDHVSGNFVAKVMKKSLTCSLTIVMNILILTVLGNILKLTGSEISTLCVIMTAYTGFLLLFRLCMPLNKLRITLIAMLILGFTLSILGLRTLFSLTILNLKMFAFIIILVIISTVIYNLLNILVDKFVLKYEKIFS